MKTFCFKFLVFVQFFLSAFPSCLPIPLTRTLRVLCPLCSFFFFLTLRAHFYRLASLSYWSLFVKNTKTSSCTQFSPYQEVTGKSYHLKQQFLPPATAWRFTEVLLKNTQVVIRFDSHMPQGNEWISGKALKYTQLFFFWAMHFGKRTLKTE